MSKERPILEEFAGLEDPANAEPYFRRLGFTDWKGAQAIFQRLKALDPQGLEAILPYLTHALEAAADPDRSLVNFSRFADAQGAGLFQELEQSPRVIEMLVTLFSTSPFLTEILLRTPDALGLLKQRAELTQRKTIEQFQMEASQVVDQAETGRTEKLDALRRYQRRQLLRIGTSDFLGLYDLRTVFSQLSRMAIGLARACLALAVEQTGIQADGLAILAAGKLGGWELNYSSDIDLLFVSRQEDPALQRLVKQFIDIVSHATAEGFLYRIDIRLRPWGHDGPLVNTLDGYLQYMQAHARPWERQAYLKARVIAGNLGLGEELRREIEPFLFQLPPEEVRSSILAMKLRTEEFLRSKGRKWGEVKLGEGSIRDVEFVVQSLQLVHPSVRTRATLKAIRELREGEYLSTEDARVLTEGYIFLRTTEHYLQMIDYRQTYTLPGEPAALALLARRLGFEGAEAGERFVEQYERHSAAIRSIFLKVVGNETSREAAIPVETAPEVREHLARLDATYAATFSEDEIRQHAGMAEQVSRERPAIVEAKLLEGSRWRITVIGYDYLGELSLICGLMFVYGMDIIDSQVFTYELEKKTADEAQHSLPFQPRRAAGRRILRPAEPMVTDRPKIVDVFTVRSMREGTVSEELWKQYADDLLVLFLKLQVGQRREAQGELAKRVGAAFPGTQKEVAPLHPIDIEIDNETSEKYTLLKIGTTDTMGFLYEFSNALALSHINIARMDVRSIGKRVSDTIYVTDERGRKIASAEKQRELRAATVLIKHFTHLLPHSPNPQAALLHFREFLGQLFERPNWPDELARLERPEVLDALAQLLGVSDFLWDDFLRMQYSNLFPVVRDVDELAAPRAAEVLQKELDSALVHSENWREALNAFKDREMFRIDMRHILGQTREFWDFSAELSDLAEVVLNTAYERVYAEQVQRYGEPLQADGTACPAALFGLGKFGGRELGFASDIELILIYAGEGKTGPLKPRLKPRPVNEFFEEVVQELVRSVRARQEGIFRIDLQLRPYGKAGSLAVRLDAFERYYSPGGPAWDYERQALVKMRPILGEAGLIAQVTHLRDQYVYEGGSFDVTAMRAMRERQLRHMVAAGTFNAKYSPGGLVDLEYLVQALQILHGGNHPALRLTNIRKAMAALAEAGILSGEDYTRLRKAHTFLRWLIDSLRVVRGSNRDVNIPTFESEEFAFLARRLGYGQDTGRLRQELAQYQANVQEISQRLLGGG